MKEPARYPNYDTEEQEAIAAFLASINHSRVKADIKARDKHPNVDGTVEIVDKRSIPQGKLDVQIRKIPSGSKSYQCPSSLYAYSQTSTLPVVLIACDPKTPTIFWRHVYGGMPEYKDGQASFIVRFDDSDRISDNEYYVDRWLALSKEYSNRIENYPALASRVAKQLDIEGVSSSDYQFFQSYVDNLNSLLSNDFQSLRSRILPPTWKFGVGISQASEETIYYHLYRIELGSKVPSVVCVDPMPFDELFTDQSAVSFSYLKRAALSAPHEMALKFYERSISEAFSGFQFIVHGIEVAKNVVGTFIERYPRVFQIDSSKDYTLQQVKDALYSGLAKACSHLVPLPVSNDQVHIGLVDLIDLESWLKAHPVPETVEPVSLDSYLIRTLDVPIQALKDAIAFLDANSVTLIRNPWLRLNRVGGFLWEIDDSLALRENVARYCDKVVANYLRFISGNSLAFPDSPYIKPDVTVAFAFEEGKESGIGGGPILHEYHLDNSDLSLPKQLGLLGFDGLELKREDKDVLVEINERTFKVLSGSSSSADWLFRPFPYLRGIYGMLARDFRDKYDYNLNVS